MVPSRDDVGANSWTEYRRLVMSGLEELKANIENVKEELSEDSSAIKEELSKNIKSSKDEIEKKIDDLSRKFNKFEIQMTIDITTLKTKASLWGGVFGAIVSAIISIVIGLVSRGGK